MRLVIVGGGFAGLHLVRQLERIRPGELQITLLDRNDYHLFTPLLYQVATGELPPHAVAYPLRRPLTQAGFRFVNTEVEAIDVEQRVVHTADGPYAYDTVVAVPGSITNDYGISGVRDHALPMKDLADARAVKRQILSSFDRAALEDDPPRRRALLTFVVIGAGPVGVELTSSMRDLMDNSLRPMYPEIDFRRDIGIVLIDGSERVLPQMDPRLSAIAMKRLKEQGIRVVLRTLVSEVARGHVVTSAGERIEGQTIVWAGGVRTSPLVAGLPLPQAKDKRLVVDRCFRVGGRDDVVSFGDAAYFEHDGRPLPQLAQVAVLQAPAVARNIARAARGLPWQPYRYKGKGDLIALGRTHAGAELRNVPLAGSVVMSGFPAWTIWRGNYLLQLLGVRNRATLLLEWTLSYFVSRMVSNTP
jgi:NADH:ubiquinone reductase (H+-translocating)